jgi:hypothetical protein
MMLKRQSEADYMIFSSESIDIGPTERKLLQFRSLEEGWHYGEGKAINLVCLDRAFDLYQEATHLALFETDAFPGLNGEVMLTIYLQDHYLEFTFEPDGKVTFYQEKDKQEVCYLEGLSYDQAKAKLKEFRRSWLGSESLVEGTMTGDTRDLQALPSRTMGTIPGSRSSIWIAFTHPETLSASTSDDTTLLSRMSRLFSGVSAQRYCQPVTD